MKKITLFLTGFFVAAIINAQTTPAQPTPTLAPAATAPTEPKDISKFLEIKEDNHDFGQIPYGKPVTFDVGIKNISSDSVKIENVKVGCGCTTPKYDQGKSYAPGESFKVTLGFSGYAEGNFEKYVDIFFSNGMSTKVKFHGTGYKVPEAAAPANAGVQKLKSAGN